LECNEGLCLPDVYIHASGLLNIMYRRKKGRREVRKQNMERYVLCGSSTGREMLAH
jgi:hypothetical protein